MGGSGRQRADRREVGRQIGMEELKDVLGAMEIAQGMLTQITQAHPMRQCVAGEIMGGEGEQHLSPMGGRQQPREAIEPGRQIIPLTRLGIGGMDRHPHLKGVFVLRPPRRPQ